MRRDGAFELVTLRNGKRAVRHTEHGEVMHPSIGPWAEANRLYVEQGPLAERLERPGAPLILFDVGLGAAANAVAALQCAKALGTRRRRELAVTSFEIDLAPLRLALSDGEGFPFLLPWRDPAHVLVEHGTWAEEGLSWTLALGDVLENLARGPGLAEIVFFDPFSPAQNSRLWSPRSFGALRACCQPNAWLATYSAATPTRVSLLLGGFFVGSGVSIGTKSETTVAAGRLDLLAAPLGTDWLNRWRRSSAQAPHGEEKSSDLESRLMAHPQFASMAPL